MWLTFGTAAVCTFMAVDTIANPRKEPPAPAVEPFDFAGPFTVTSYPDPKGESGIYEPHYVVIDGKGSRIKDFPNDPPGVVRQVTLSGGRIVLHCYHRDYPRP